MKIRAENILDYPTIAKVNTLAFRGKKEAKLVEFIRSSNAYISELSLVAEIEDHVVGYIMFSYVDLVTAQEQLPVLSLAPMAVHPQFQHQGIGKALLKTGLELADNRGEALVVVLGYPKLYHPFGFQAAINYQIECPFNVPEDFFMVKPLSGYEDKYQGKVIYPPEVHNV
ncbi:MAG: N-acetyltransferase [Sphaerospermopsis sp.]|uniref:GNAT family N-acetyltransferase n=1 Tax=Sphaerospermopsis sp. LEGE 00249 TaxID=1380707 RepID=UPI00164DAA97|nr:N-acetyltransferase [Sphaerospermopsis sp. LEGE 00249]MBC5795299.1 N-acetyltransferase [Sphaerospermopsis sp. LEGE 00249]MEB3147831.1 N-acetyltransferase [Sphaerospermopsis sp.]